MVAGLGFYMDSRIYAIFDSTQVQLFEYSYQKNYYSHWDEGEERDSNYDELTNVNISQSIQNAISKITTTSINTLIKSLYPFVQFDPDENSYWNINGANLTDKWEEINQWRFSIFILDFQIYKTLEFQHLYPILVGTFPTDENEIIISEGQASANNLQVGDEIYYTPNINWFDKDLGEYYLNETKASNVENIPKFRISGVFQEPNADRLIGSMSNFVYQPFDGYAKFWFGFHNFTQSDNLNPLLNWTRYIDELKQLNEQSLGFKLGGGISIDTNYEIQLTKLGEAKQWSVSTYHKITDELRNIHELDGYLLSNSIAYTLDRAEEEINFFRATYYPLTIPVLIFAIIIGSIITKANYSSKQEEFLLFLSKGTSYQTLRTQVFVDGVFIGLIAGIISSGLGFLTKKLYEGVIDGFLISDEIEIFDSRYYSFNTILTTILISIIFSVFAMISSMQYIKKLRTEQILQDLGKDDLVAAYDEVHLFGLSNQESKIRSVDPKEKEIYENVLNLIEDKFSGKIKIYLIIASLPLLLAIVLKISEIPNMPDSILYIISLLADFHSIIIFLSVLGIGFLIVAFIQFMFIDSPSRFAKLSRFLAKPFVKLSAHLVGIEIIKRKQYRQIILLIALFIALETFLNISIQTNYSGLAMIDNKDIGSDLRLSFFPSNVSNLDSDKIRAIEEDLEHIGIDGYTEKMVEKACLSTKYQLGDWNNGNITADLPHEIILIANWSKYAQTLYQMDTIELYRDYIEDIKSIFSNSERNLVNFNLGEDVIRNERRNDIVYEPSKYNFTFSNIEFNGSIQNITYDAGKIAIACPGVRYSEDETQFWMWDLQILDQMKISLNSTEIQIFFKLTDSAWENLELLKQAILNNLSTISTYEEDFYYSFSIRQSEGPISIFNYSDYGIDLNVMIYVILFNVGILLALALGIFIVNFQQENYQTNGLLLARGFGKDGIFKLSFAILTIILGVSIVLGILVGLIYASISTLFVHNLSSGYSSEYFKNNLTLRINLQDECLIVGIISLTSISFYLLAFLFQSRKSIQEYFRRF